MSIKSTILQHLPLILTGLGTMGVIATAYSAICDHKNARNWYDYEFEGDVPENRLQMAKLTWKFYIRTYVIAGLTITCIVGANHIGTKRQLAIASLYSLTDLAFKEYRQKNVETIGQRKEKGVYEEALGKRINSRPVGSSEIILTGKGEALFYDSISGRYFKSNIEHIRRTVNTLNTQIINQSFVALDELYYEIGLKPTKISNDVGWNLDTGLIELSFGTCLTDSGEACIVLDYAVTPRHL